MLAEGGVLDDPATFVKRINQLDAGNGHRQLMSTLYGLAPVIDTRARTLILGSFPSAASLAAGQYYAHRQNQFWRTWVHSSISRFTRWTTRSRWPHIQAAGIAVWDVYATCEREGSLDSDIRAC